MSREEISINREKASNMSFAIAMKIKSLYRFINENFEDCFDYNNTDAEFPVYDFEFRQHYDTYKTLAKNFEKPLPDKTDDE